MPLPPGVPPTSTPPPEMDVLQTNITAPPPPQASARKICNFACMPACACSKVKSITQTEERFAIDDTGLPAGRPAGAALTIRLPGGGALLLCVLPGATADAVVRRAAAACGLAPSQLALFCGGRRLGGPAPLSRAGGVRSGGTLRVVQRLAGGGAGAGRMRDAPKTNAHQPSTRNVKVGKERIVAWKKGGGTELEAVLNSGAVALLDAEWVIARAASGGVLLPRQALPDKAFLSLSQVQANTEAREGYIHHLSVFCVSHCWLQPDHPDPRGHNLRAVARVRSRILHIGAPIASGSSSTFAPSTRTAATSMAYRRAAYSATRPVSPTRSAASPRKTSSSSRRSAASASSTRTRTRTS